MGSFSQSCQIWSSSASLRAFKVLKQETTQEISLRVESYKKKYNFSLILLYFDPRVGGKFMENSTLFSFFLYKYSLFTNPILLMLRCNLCCSRRRKKNYFWGFPTFLLLRSLKKNGKLNLLKFSLILIFVNLSWDWFFYLLFWTFLKYTKTLFLFCWNRERSMEKNIQKEEEKKEKVYEKLF